jgi:hypothetical protein
MLSSTGIKEPTSVSPLRMKMKSAAAWRPCSMKNLRFMRELPSSESA